MEPWVGPEGSNPPCRALQPYLSFQMFLYLKWTLQ